MNTDNKKTENQCDIHTVSGGICKPLCVGFLDDLKEKIYKEQFFDYDETIDAEVVLDSLQNLRSNPKLLDYVLKCLAKEKIDVHPHNFYAVVVNAETIMPYNEKIHKTFEAYIKYCVEGDFGIKKRDHLLKKVYDGMGDIELEMMKSEGEDIWAFGNTKFERYTIHVIGAIKGHKYER